MSEPRRFNFQVKDGRVYGDLRGIRMNAENIDGQCALGYDDATKGKLYNQPGMFGLYTEDAKVLVSSVEVV